MKELGHYNTQILSCISAFHIFKMDQFIHDPMFKWESISIENCSLNLPMFSFFMTERNKQFQVEESWAPGDNINAFCTKVTK